MLLLILLHFEYYNNPNDIENENDIANKVQQIFRI